jgi:hypothetical protein
VIYRDDEGTVRKKKLVYKGRDGNVLNFYNDWKKIGEDIHQEQFIRSQEIQGGT